MATFLLLQVFPGKVEPHTVTLFLLVSLVNRAEYIAQRNYGLLIFGDF